MVSGLIRNYRYKNTSGRSIVLAGPNHRGLDPNTTVSLIGESALGQHIDGVFKVQVNRFDHPWSHGWHETPREEYHY